MESDVVDVDSDVSLITEEQFDHYLQMKDVVRDILDATLTAHLQNETATVKKRLRNLAVSEPQVFRFVVIGAYRDTSDEDEIIFPEGEQYQEMLEEANDLGQRYQSLEPDFVAVYLEVISGQRNPISSYRSSVGYDSDYQQPIVDYQAISGSQEILDIRVPVETASNLSASLMRAIKESVRRCVDDDLEIGKESRESVEKTLEVVKEELDQMESLLEDNANNE